MAVAFERSHTNLGCVKKNSFKLLLLNVFFRVAVRFLEEVIMRCIPFWFCALALFPSVSAASSASEEVFDKPQALAVLPSHKSIAGNKDIFSEIYGASGSNPNWIVSQWDIPVDLPPFQQNKTENQYASVQFNPPNGFQLSQDGSALSCEKTYPSGKHMVDEFDLFVGPMTHPIESNLGVKRAGHARRPLSGIRAIILSVSYSPKEPIVINRDCRISRSVGGIGVVLTDSATKQTLFYQLNFNLFQAQNGVMEPINLPPGWFFTGINSQAGGNHQFGYGDRLWASFGYPQVKPGQTFAANLDILPRMKQLISEGAKFGLDQNLSNWAVTGEYYGQSVFGHVSFATEWKNYLLLIQNADVTDK